MPEAATVPAAILVTGLPWRSGWKYAERGWRHVYWDAGTMLANLLAVADAHGVSVRPVLGFVDDGLCRLLGVDGVTEFPVAAVLLGPGQPNRSAPDQPPPLEAAAARLSPAPVEFPLVTQVQRAGRLTDPEAVRAWRRSPPARVPPSQAVVDLPRCGTPDPVEQVILRRGSTRLMRHGSVPADLLRWGLAAATRTIPADAIPDVTALLSVHDVEAYRSGRYAWAGSQPKLRTPATEPEARATAAHLCLDQPLGGDSGYTAFICGDLDAVLTRYGDRGYRVAQLVAGVVAGRLQLAAFSLGYGGTGLTFYDREVSRVFDTSEACLMVAAIGIPGYRSRPGGAPGRPTRLTGGAVL